MWYSTRHCILGKFTSSIEYERETARNIYSRGNVIAPNYIALLVLGVRFGGANPVTILRSKLKLITGLSRAHSSNREVLFPL